MRIEDNHLIRRVTIGDTEITLLGTAHVSHQSVADVEHEILNGNHDVIAVELCTSRHRSLTDPASLEQLDLFQVIRNGKAGMVMASLALGAYQQRLADQFDIKPGAELEAAASGARRSGKPLWLVDRDIGVTLKRVYRSIPWWQRPTVITGLLLGLISRQEIKADEIERLKQGDMLEATFREFAAQSPALHEPLIGERDRFMAARLLEELKQSPERPNRVLVVMGAGHLGGVEQALSDHADFTARQAREARQQLEVIPPPARWPKVLPWILVAVILAGFAIGFSRGPELGMRLIVEWIVINGSLCALGSALARAHPVTIVGSFFAAPLTSLNPTIGAGLVSALIELGMRRPRVGDFRGLRDAVKQWRGWWHNRVSRTLLVFLFAATGSMAGTYIAGFRILDALT
ncbi:MAG: TraB/GumN family protein [Gammaproteobacteria bacterium]|nr:TraB/GumN family protein [Gammaproteobacteria bacterium]